MLEINRLVIKSMNLLIAMAIKPDHKKISDYLSEKRNQHEAHEKHFPKKKTWREETQMIESFMTFVQEALKFVLLSFFKQCRIILRILEKFHEMRKERDDSKS